MSRPDVLLNEALISVRGLRRERAFALISVVLLAAGIGFASAVFTLLWQVLYAQLPVPDAQQIYSVTTNVTHMGRSQSDAPVKTFSAPAYRYLSQEFHGAPVFARHGEMVNLETPGGPRHLLCDFVSGNFFRALEVKPVLGRYIQPQDDTRSETRFVAVLSYNFWQEEFGGQVSAWNQTIRINNAPFRIIGVAPRSFTGLIAGQAARVYVPIEAFPPVNPGWKAQDDWGVRWLNLFVRLPKDLPQARAEAALQPVYRAAVRQELSSMGIQNPGYVKELAHEHLALTPASQGVHGMLDGWRQPLCVLLWMTAAVLLLTCLNVAGLAVVRAVKQRQEVLVRYALGATRSAVIRLGFMQMLAIAIAGGIGALWIARWGAAALVYLGQMDRAGALVTKPAGVALGLHWAAVAVVALLIGLLPAWYAARVNLSEGLSQGAATHSSGRKHALARHALASLQIALSLVLLIAAALFAKSLHKLTSVPVGFDAKNLVVFSIDPKLAGSTVQGTAALYSRVEQRLRGTPGVAAVTYGTGGPFPQEADVAVMIPGGGFTGAKHQSGFRSVIGPDYFRTLGIPVIAGREFDARDRLNGPDTVVINEALAHKLFGTKNPVGQTVGMFNGLDPNWVATIVGIVRDYHVSWKRSNTSLIYTPAQQQRRISAMTFYVRTQPGASLSEQSIRALVRSEAPALSAYDVESMSMRMEEFASGERAMSLLTASFAVLALIIAVIGIYGVVAYSASMRMTEFGIRMAMGAQPRQIISLVVREALLIFASGCAIAAPLLWLGLSGIRSQLYGTAPYQPPVFILATAILGAFSLAVAFIPARRATRLNVQGALRHE